jgi:hypothetical protein
MAEKEVEMSPAGELRFKIPQQQWTGNNLINSSYFAGQEMIIKKSDGQPDEYELHYLGLKVSGFEDLEDAQFNAPEFARSVFQILSGFVKDR